jgi:hypothetical protein
MRHLGTDAGGKETWGGKEVKKVKKAAAVFVSLAMVICGFVMDAYADGTAWDIENTLDVSECRQGDTVTMSVNLKGSGASSAQEITFIEGTLEYDSSLFTVEKADILPAEDGKAQSCSFDPSTGTFSVQYSPNIAVQDGGRMLQIRLHTAADASIGKTTLCVTHMKWNDAAGRQAVEIEHRVPARITIAEAETPAVAGDVNQDGKVNLTDAKLVMQHYNGAKTLDSRQKENADVNGDGKVNLTDAKLIMKYYNGEITGF